MSEKKLHSATDANKTFVTNGTIKDAVCVDCNRVFDSCADKDCLEDLVCIFTEEGQALVDTAVAIKARTADILSCCVEVDPVTYNKGCYAVTCNYYFTVVFDVYQSTTTAPDAIRGLCTFEKKCMLYGSDGDVQVFSSEVDCDETQLQLPGVRTEPVAKVKAVDPMVLSSRTMCCENNCRCQCPTQIPQFIVEAMGGNLALGDNYKTVLVTLGLFSIVQLSRNVQVLIPAYDYCIPSKECSCDQGSPCDIFSEVDFPVEDFFPRATSGSHCGCGCKQPMQYEGECCK